MISICPVVASSHKEAFLYLKEISSMWNVYDGTPDYYSCYTQYKLVTLSRTTYNMSYQQVLDLIKSKTITALNTSQLVCLPYQGGRYLFACKT
jgi:hypothetical protein